VLERMTDLPGDAIGFRASGRLTRDDYQEMMRPVHERLEAGGRIDLLFVAEAGFAGLDAGALWEDVKAAGSVGVRHRDRWRRFAIVTDKPWLQHWANAFGWLSPGELRVFALDGLDAAKRWLAEPAAT
jgi:hypothetical protein